MVQAVMETFPGARLVNIKTRSQLDAAEGIVDGFESDSPDLEDDE